VELVHQVDAAAMIHPGVLHAAVETEGNSGAESKGWVLAPVVVAAGVANLDRALGNLVGGFKARCQFAGRKDLDLELAVGRIGDIAGERLGGAEDRVEALGKTRGQTPVDLRRALRDRRSGHGTGRDANPCAFEEIS